MASALSSYLKETQRPVYSAALILPFFVIYHVGTIILGTTYINGADALIIRILAALSFRSAFASALVLLLCFVVWQLRTRASWKVDSRKLMVLFGESLFFAGLLFVVFGWLSAHLSIAYARNAFSTGMTRWVLYCGAGVYEELLFRGFLLGSLLFFFTRLAGMKKPAASVCSALLAALLFSACRSARKS